MSVAVSVRFDHLINEIKSILWKADFRIKCRDKEVCIFGHEK